MVKILPELGPHFGCHHHFYAANVIRPIKRVPSEHAIRCNWDEVLIFSLNHFPYPLTIRTLQDLMATKTYLPKLTLAFLSNLLFLSTYLPNPTYLPFQITHRIWAFGGNPMSNYVN